MIRSRRKFIIKLITWTIRILVGAVFIFSGFAKSVDPWGTLYKVQDYLAAMGLSLWPNLVLVGVFALCAVEFLLGAMLILGCLRRTTAVASTAMMCFMLPLTLWIAIANPVADCGCFGEAFTISNWTTFWKNVVLMAGAVWLLRNNRKAGCLISPSIQWLAIVASSLYVLALSLAGYYYQPLVDFRAYKVGTALIDDDDETADPEYVYVYQKDGKQREFQETDELPDESEGWQFVERRALQGNSEKTADDGKNLRIWSVEDGEEDVTADVLYPEGDRLLLMMPDLGKVSPATTWQINSLYSWAKKNGIDMIAIVSGNPQQIAQWEDLAMPEYEIYTAEDTSIKEVVRGNPAVVFTRDGVVEWKSSLAALVTEDFMAPGVTTDPMDFGRDNSVILINITCLWLSVLSVLLALSVFPRRLLLRQ